MARLGKAVGETEYNTPAVLGTIWKNRLEAVESGCLDGAKEDNEAMAGVLLLSDLIVEWFPDGPMKEHWYKPLLPKAYLGYWLEEKINYKAFFLLEADAVVYSKHLIPKAALREIRPRGIGVWHELKHRLESFGFNTKPILLSLLKEHFLIKE